jgi:hypothetical protein
VLTLGLELFKLLFVSRRYDVGFRDVYRVLGGDDVTWDSLLMFALSEIKLTRIVTILVMSNMYLYCVVWMITSVLLLLQVLYVFLPVFLCSIVTDVML